MSEMTGIRSVDFKVVAKGHGVVNWNGTTTVSLDGKEVNNHSMPKLRGYTNLTGKVKADTGYKYKKEANDVDFTKTPMYVSQNCVRHHLFKDHAYDLHFAKNKNLDEVLASFTGLVRGYVVASSQCKRSSPLLMEDFVDTLGNGNFEQFVRSGTKEKTLNKNNEESSTSIFSKITFGDTRYVSYGSISVENLQFISLDNKFDRRSIIIKDSECQDLATKISNYIQSISKDSSLRPEVTFHENYVRAGTIYGEGEVGLLLNDDAIEIVIAHTIKNIEELSIVQSKSYMCVESVEVDFNDSSSMMRIKHDPASVSPAKTTKYATYYNAE